MSGLLFQDAQPAATSSPNRADVVCFIGFVGRRATPLPDGLKSWLQDQGWRGRDRPVTDADPLLDTPVPLESFEAFDRLFAWEHRPPLPHAFPYGTWLGAAVRSFFRQGGARCFVVRIDDPGPYRTPAAVDSPAEHLAFTATRRARLGQLLPGFIGPTAPPSPADPATWRGLGTLLGLEEAAFVCLPDLPELVADAALEPGGLAPVEPGPEVFVECAPEIVLPRDEARQLSSSPACTEAGYREWRQAVRHAARFLREHRRDMELVLTLPLPSPDLTWRYTRQLNRPSGVLGLGRNLDEADGLATAFLQLAYPWLITPGSETLPGGLEPPDGVFAGVLARAIPELGVAHSIGRQVLHGVHGFEPRLPGADLALDTPKGADPALIHRVCLLGRTPDAVRVLSDVTTSLSETHRPAPVGRLTAALLRTARHLGDSALFEPAGEALWQKIRTQLDRLLAEFHAAGALHGDNATDAYSIRCDATTTTPHDLDHGRVIAEIRFAPAHPVGLITVVLSLREGTVTTVDATL
ncbi:MAG: phage tail sheath protein [Limisphaerales bacterium]